jgi:hypothetical protein
LDALAFLAAEVLEEAVFFAPVAEADFFATDVALPLLSFLVRRGWRLSRTLFSQPC